MAADFSGKVALVTGGGSGIGRATAKAFAANGAKLVIGDWVIEGAQETVEQIRAAGGDAVCIKTDVSQEEDVKAMVKLAIDTFGRLDIAHNNAGVDSYPPSRIINLSATDWDRTININLRGVFLCLKHEIPEMIRQGGGAIVNTSSTAAFVGIVGGASYSASKHAVIGLTKSAALESWKKNIRVNAVCPGPVDTPLMDKIMGDSPLVRQRMQESLRAGRMAQPEEIAAMVIWLCSDAASYVTGAAMVVDGGSIS